MWSNWEADVVRKDFRRLADNGVRVLRVFPLWPDFQPITMLYGQSGNPVEVRHGEVALEDAAASGSGVSPVMLGRLTELCDIAAQTGIELILGLVTGWMSGRLFVPPALSGRDPLNDPLSMTWQIKLVRAIVRHARNEKSIVAWDLGNECNCMGQVSGREAAYVWTAAIANAIRAADATRPVISGMHSLGTAVGRVDGRKALWTIEDQGELTDILTTHPYPYWTRHTRADRVDSLRTTLHATAETRLYADVSGRPCFAEEIGTMGPMVASDEASADFARVNLFSLWANDCRGFLWWCSSDQHALAHAPYDWNGVELELGLLREDGSAKPVLNELADFGRFIGDLPFDRLPRRDCDAICLLTNDQDDWAAAFGAFVLGKQAGLEMDFRQIEQPLVDAAVYLLPGLKGGAAVPRRKWAALIDRVRQGATLYLSLDDGIVPHFNAIAGVDVIGRSQSTEPCAMKLADGTVMPLRTAERLLVRNRSAEILGTRADDGAPLFWRHRLGQGTVIVLAAPIEVNLTLTPKAFDDDAAPFWKTYAAVAAFLPAGSMSAKDNPHVAITRHRLSESRHVVVAINHTAKPQAVEYRWPTSGGIRALHGPEVKMASGKLLTTLPGFTASVVMSDG